MKFNLIVVAVLLTGCSTAPVMQPEPVYPQPVQRPVLVQEQTANPCWNSVKNTAQTTVDLAVEKYQELRDSGQLERVKNAAAGAAVDVLDAAKRALGEDDASD